MKRVIYILLNLVSFHRRGKGNGKFSFTQNGVRADCGKSGIGAGREGFDEDPIVS